MVLQHNQVVLERILVVVAVDNLVEVADRHLEPVDMLHIAVELDLVDNHNLVEPY